MFICTAQGSASFSDPAMEFYPPKYWGLDPIYHACVKLTIADVLNLLEHPMCKGTYLTWLSLLCCMQQNLLVATNLVN